ncbi:DUF7195 family protein, partial [Herbiconiux daphne]
LDNVVTIRKIPMSNAGCDNLRAIQKWMQEGFGKVLKTQVEVPFPTVINNVLADYVKLKNIPVETHVSPAKSDVKPEK